MKCKSCGFDNEGNSKYCSRCGSHLAQLSNKKVYCTECGFENSGRSKYCTECGEELIRISAKTQDTGMSRKAAKRKRKSRVEPIAPTAKKSSFTLYLALFTVAVVGILIVVAMNRKSTPLPQIAASELSLTDSFLEAQILTVATKFRCSCGTCGGTPLEDCSCETAVAERQFIRDKLKAGLEVEKVIAAVNRAYGWMKPEFEKQYGDS